MPSPAMSPAHAFRTLQLSLLSRRAASMGTRLWLVTLALCGSMGAFVYWQVRVPLDGTLHHGGVAAATLRLGVSLAACLVAAAIVAASRQVTLAADPPGPEWLALPLEPALVERHLAREARLPAFTMFVPAIAVWLAGFGLLSPITLLLAAPAFVLVFWLLTRVACALALRSAAVADGPARGLPAPWRALTSARRPVRTRRVAAPRFRTGPRWRALARLDRVVSLRSGSPRARLVLTALLLAVSVAAWFAGSDPREQRAQAFAGFSLACATLGAWAAWRAAGDPPSALRPLPLTLSDSWRARALPMFALLAPVLALHGTIPAVPWHARFGLALSWTLPAVIVTLLGLHIGLSLPGRARAAENLYYGWLGAGVVASLAIPLFGWGMLIAAFAHATRRLVRWNTPEVA